MRRDDPRQHNALVDCAVLLQVQVVLAHLVDGCLLRLEWGSKCYVDVTDGGAQDSRVGLRVEAHDSLVLTLDLLGVAVLQLVEAAVGDHRIDHLLLFVVLHHHILHLPCVL